MEPEAPQLRTTGQKLKDAHHALRSAKAELNRAVKQRDDANNYVATRRYKVDQIEACIAALQVKFDAEPKPESEEPVGQANKENV